MSISQQENRSRTGLFHQQLNSQGDYSTFRQNPSDFLLLAEATHRIGKLARASGSVSS